MIIELYLSIKYLIACVKILDELSEAIKTTLECQTANVQWNYKKISLNIWLSFHFVFLQNVLIVLVNVYGLVVRVFSLWRQGIEFNTWWCAVSLNKTLYLTQRQFAQLANIWCNCISKVWCCHILYRTESPWELL